MLVKLKKEYLQVWLKRLSAVDLGANMHDICKAIYIRLYGDVLTLIRTGNHRSFAIIQTDEIEDVEDAEEAFEALISSDRLSSIIDKFSDGVLRLGTPSENDFYVEQNGYRGRWKQKYGKDDFPSEKALSFVSKMSELDNDAFQTIDTKQFVKAVREIKYAPLKSSYNPSLRNLIFDGKSCWAVNHNRYHERTLVDFPQMNLVLTFESLTIADFIHLSGVTEFGFYTDESHYLFKVGDDCFVLEKCEFVAEDERKALLSKYESPDYIKFNISSSRFLEAVERVGITADSGNTTIALTCLDNWIVLESEDKLGNRSKESLPISYSGSSKTKFIMWDCLATSLNSVSPLDIEVGMNTEMMSILTDDDKVILSFIKG